MKLTIRSENPDSQALASAASTTNGEKRNSPQSAMVPRAGSPEPEPVRGKDRRVSPVCPAHADPAAGHLGASSCLGLSV